MSELVLTGADGMLGRAWAELLEARGVDHVATTIEDAGLAPPGGFGAFLRGAGLGPDGDHPLNTHGGQLGFGQPDLAGGMTHVVEAVRQLRGSAEGRQIKGATSALVTGNGATMSEAVALVLGAEA